MSIKCSDGEIFTHSLVLSAVSPFLNKLLVEEGVSGRQKLQFVLFKALKSTMCFKIQKIVTLIGMKYLELKFSRKKNITE